MINLLTNFFLFSSSEQTDSEIACEEAARLTAELQEGGESPDDDDEINYNELPPPPGKPTSR